ncbi:2'-5' RNA ligase family protein [Acholeplasma hippikon]|uniref:2'-5' RNA ligase n=1 Tax=Acholeplasma hippikon TaxID=264636 RepID=A0A449BI69_9MOLU|nr:2'-5' RNA ligase family protein [Acholeplasma hippikon]VEU82132.1 Uncharacterised protein [Acholeplasma hippikon]
MKDYAIIVRFDETSEYIIQSFIEEINLKLNTNFNIPPHITLGVFKTDNLTLFMKDYDRFVSELVKGEVTFSSLGTFVPKVLFLAPVINEVLLKNHGVIHRFLENANKDLIYPSNYLYYTKNHWQPHCTIGINYTKTKLKRAIEAVLPLVKPLTVQIKSIHLVEAHPYVEISEFDRLIGE